MSIRTLSIVASALLATAAFAQTPKESLGTVRNVQGLVTDIDGASVTSTETGEAIHDGERFVTSSSGSVTLQLNNGCSVTLQPNQAVTIDKGMTCRELLASVGRVGGAGALAFGGNGLLAGGTILAAGYLVHRDLKRNNNVSGGGQFNQGNDNDRNELERGGRDRGQGGGGQGGGNDGQGGDR
jgi:hypothetical protein